MSGYPTGVVAGAGIAKDKVNYRLAPEDSQEKCKTCAYFYPLNSCKRVKGNISPDALCDLWELIDSDSHRPDKEYFKKAYDRAQKIKKDREVS